MLPHTIKEYPSLYAAIIAEKTLKSMDIEIQLFFIESTVQIICELKQYIQIDKNMNKDCIDYIACVYLLDFVYVYNELINKVYIFTIEKLKPTSFITTMLKDIYRKTT